jgi:hypothetical protein
MGLLLLVMGGVEKGSAHNRDKGDRVTARSAPRRRRREPNRRCDRHKRPGSKVRWQ